MTHSVSSEAFASFMVIYQRTQTNIRLSKKNLTCNLSQNFVKSMNLYGSCVNLNILKINGFNIILHICKENLINNKTLSSLLISSLYLYKHQKFVLFLCLLRHHQVCEQGGKRSLYDV